MFRVMAAPAPGPLQANSSMFSSESEKAMPSRTAPETASQGALPLVTVFIAPAQPGFAHFADVASISGRHGICSRNLRQCPDLLDFTPLAAIEEALRFRSSFQHPPHRPNQLLRLLRPRRLRDD